MPRYFKLSSSRDDSGSVLIIMAFAFVILLFLAGFAIDGVRLYHGRSSLQKLVDTAALGVIGYTIHTGPSKVATRFGLTSLNVGDAEINPVLTQLAREIANANAKALGWTDGTLEIDARRISSVTDDTFKIQVDARRRIQYLLIDKVPLEIIGVPRTSTSSLLSATAQSARRPANVSIVADLSQSMACPTFQPCTCLSAARTGPCPSPKKIDTLVDALTIFLSRFDLRQDRIQFVPFQIVAKAFTLDDLIALARSVGGYSGPSLDHFSTDAAMLVNQVRNLLRTVVTINPPIGNTNFTDALLSADKRMVEEVGLQSPKAYVFFTDGAPTATTLNLSNPVTGSALPKNPVGSNERQYVSYTNDWSTSTGRWPAPSALAARSSFENLFLWGLRFDGRNPPPGSVPACSTPDGTGRSPVPPDAGAAALNSAVNQVFAGCVTNLGFSFAGATDPQTGAPLVFGAGTKKDDPGFLDWRKQFFNSAIAQSDQMRTRNGTLHVIGFGAPAAPSADCYQDVEDTQSRHDYFLARLANDYLLAKRVNGNNYAECDFSGGRSFTQLNNQANPRQGKYYPIDPGDDMAHLLNQAYEQIAIEIQLSLLN